MERKRKSGKRNNIFFFALAALAVLAVIVLIYWSVYRIPILEQEVNMYLNVGNYAGIDINASALHYGTALISSKITREMIITNTADRRLKTKLLAEGELAGWTEISENNFYLLPSENKTVQVSVSVPSDAEMGDYAGKLR